MTTTLITGANKGLGYRTGLRLLAAGHEVWVSARDARLGLAAAVELGARFVQLDVTDDASVEAAVERVAAAGGLDVLVNNAGIADRTAVVDAGASDVGRVLATNVLGVVRVLQAFAGLLDASSAPVVVNVSSGLGSLAYASDPSGPYAGLDLLAYPASKAALNMLTIQWARAHPRWRVNAADPGFTPPTSTITGAPRPSRKEPMPSSDWRASDRTVRRARSPTAAVSCPGEARRARGTPRPLSRPSEPQSRRERLPRGIEGEVVVVTGERGGAGEPTALPSHGRRARNAASLAGGRSVRAAGHRLLRAESLG